MSSFTKAAVLLALASCVSAQGYGGYGNPYSSGDNPYSSSGSSSSGSAFGDYADFESFISSKRAIVMAHAIMAAAAFAFIFPVGGILIRVASFRGLWLLHAVVQVLGWLLYVAAFGIGVYMAVHLDLMNQAHAVIGIVLFILLLFQPLLGFLHHHMFKKHARRVVWSYGHIWLGRILITLGIVNGGLGLQLAQQTRIFAPSTGAIIGYSVVAAVMWLLYVAAAIYGESKRASAPQDEKHRRRRGVSDTEAGAPRGKKAYYKNQRSGQRYA